MKLLTSIIIVCSAALLPAAVNAGEFQVSPIRLDLGKTAKSGVITVSNVGSEKVNLQVQATEWTQDKNGKDIYSETSDIVYFPRIISLEKGDAQVIRVGMKGAPPTSEKTYRLYIQEIPEKKKTEKGKVQVAIAIRFGVPIFIKPGDDNLKGAIDTVSVAKGTAKVLVKNTGNTHFKITTITFTGKTADGKEIFSKEIQGWYLLAGASREYAAPLTPDVCGRLEQLQFVVTAEELTLTGSHPVYKEMCLP